MVSSQPAPMRLPPGFAGDIARYFLFAAPRPLPEAAIAATLGLLAGTCGGSHTISKPRTGLNLFVILLALSGMGKEPLHRINHLLSRACVYGGDGLHEARKFVVPNRSASGPALSRRLASNPHMVQVMGELGRRLTEMATAQTSSPMFGLMTLMTELYEQSGPTAVVSGTDYSDPSKNVEAILGASYSVLGESTPETFYGAITPSTMENGFLSRWTAIECERTDKPDLAPDPDEEPSPELLDVLSCMLYHCLQQRRQPLHLHCDSEAAELLEDFRVSCDDAVNRAGTDAARRAIWNRSHMKAYRAAGLLACADFYLGLRDWYRANCQGDRPQPLIRASHVDWARALEVMNAHAINTRLDCGNVGTGDDVRQRKLLHVIHEYLSKPIPTSYGVPAAMPRDAVVPRFYLHRRISDTKAFSQHPHGAKRALDDAIQGCCDNGYLAEMPKDKAGEAYTFVGRCFRVVRLPAFGNGIDD